MSIQMGHTALPFCAASCIDTILPYIWMTDEVDFYQIGLNEREQHSVELREMSPEHLELHRIPDQAVPSSRSRSGRRSPPAYFSWFPEVNDWTKPYHVVSDPHEGNEELATDHGQLFDDSQHLPLRLTPSDIPTFFS